MLKNTPFAFGSISKFFHWTMAALFLGMFTVAYIMINIPRSDFMFSLYDLHKATGLLLFTLAALRLIWVLLNAHPPLPGSIALWRRRAAVGNIVVLYLLMFAMPISGFLTSTLGGHEITFYHIFTLAPLAQNKAASAFFSQAHELLAYLLIAAFSLHVAGALFHHYVLKDGVLKRML